MAFLQDPARQPFLRAPAAVVWLIAILIGIYGLQAILLAANTPQMNYVINTYGFVPAWYSPHYLATNGVTSRGWLHQALPFVTYTFLHGSWAHVLINSVWLLAFGPVVARRFGTLLFIAFFLLCGVIGAASHLAAYWGSTIPVVGASAAISGLMGASFRLLSFGPPASEPVALAPIFSARILTWSAIWMVVNLVAGLTGIGAGGGANVVAWVAHLGGYFAGLLLAGPFDRLARR